ncbi:MAG: thioredoxin domain-containing protein [Caldisericia bacterium]|jgi:thioredoxin 1|nr:thioredoxin domain-containing protein [Caldisericia bacterium]
MSLKKLTQEDFEEKILNKSGIKIVKFTAEWCYPCKVIEPHLVKLEKLYNGEVEFYEVDVEENSFLASEYDIVNLPTLLVFKDKKVIGSIVGALSFESLKKELNEILNRN